MRPERVRTQTTSRRGSLPASSAPSGAASRSTGPLEAPVNRGSASRPMLTTIAATTRMTRMPPTRITAVAARSFCFSLSTVVDRSVLDLRELLGGGHRIERIEAGLGHDPLAV